MSETLADVRDSKHTDETRWQAELDTYRTRLNQIQSEIAKKEALIDELRFENRSLKNEVAEIKRDSECMGRLLDDEVTRAAKVDDKERAVKL